MGLFIIVLFNVSWGYDICIWVYLEIKFGCFWGGLCVLMFCGGMSWGDLGGFVCDYYLGR